MTRVELAYKDDLRELHVGRLLAPYAFDSPYGGDDFALLLAAGVALGDAERGSIAADVVVQGCRALLAAGVGCRAWAAAFEAAHAQTKLPIAPRAGTTFLATSHPEDAVEEVASQLVTQSFFDDFLPRRFLLLVVGEEELLLARYRKAVMDELRRDF